jgi:hypothetical protein
MSVTGTMEEIKLLWADVRTDNAYSNMNSG